MSGKSTLLRIVGLKLLLAYAGVPTSTNAIAFKNSGVTKTLGSGLEI